MMPTRGAKRLCVALSPCYGRPQWSAPRGRVGVEFKLSGRKVLSNIKIDVGQEKTTYQILDPDNGSVIAVGSIPANEWNSLQDALMDQIDDHGVFTLTRLLQYVSVLLIHSGLERFEHGN